MPPGPQAWARDHSWWRGSSLGMGGLIEPLSMVGRRWSGWGWGWGAPGGLGDGVMEEEAKVVTGEFLLREGAVEYIKSCGCRPTAE